MKKIGTFLLAFLLMTGASSTEAYATSIEDVLAAYGTTESPMEVAKGYGEDYMESFAAMDEDTLNYVVDNYVGFQQEAAEAFLGYVENDTLGAYEKIGKVTAVESGSGYDVTVIGEFEKVNVVMTVECRTVFETLSPVDISFSLEEKDTTSMGEKMKDAALNTVMGLFTVFVVLILISFIISRFKYIPMLEEKLAKKKEKVDTEAEAVPDVAAQLAEREELVDDTELVAVITAAICASTGASADGFVVRSIRKSKRNA